MSKIKPQARKSQPIDRFGEMGGPFPPKHKWEATLPQVANPMTIMVGKGDTPEEAIEDLRQRVEKDPLNQVWYDLFDWPVAA